MESNNFSGKMGSLLKKIYEKYYPYELFVALYVLVIPISLLFFVSDGLFVTDEVVYFLTVNSLVENNSLEIWNGLDEINHTALRFTNLTTVSNGRLYSQYPPLYAFMAYPFYRFLGFHGLFVINLFAFSISILVLYAIVAKVFCDKFLALATVFAYSLFTYSLEFSIDLWPHMLSVALVLASFYLMLGLHKSSLRFFIVGFVSACAVGVRYQNIVFSIILAIYVLFAYDLKRAIPLLAGLSIPLLLVSSMNYSLFNSLTGYSGLDVFFGGYSYFYFALLVILCLILCLIYPKLSSMFNKKRVISFYVLLILVASVFFQIADSAWLEKVKTSMHVAYSEVFDIGSFPLVDVTSSKKSLLQSTPFLILALFAFTQLLRSKTKSDVLVLFMAFSILEIVFFSSVVKQHGEYTSNMRFLLESVPFLTALSIYAIRDFLKNITHFELRVYFVLFLSVLLIFIVANRDTLVFPFYRTFPLILVLFLIALHPLQYRYGGVRKVYASFIVVVFAYSFFISMSELAISQVSREVQKEISGEVCKNIVGDSLVLYPKNIDIISLAPARLCANPRFGFIETNKSSDALRLIEFYVKQGTAVYLIDDGTSLEWSMFAENLRLQYKHNITLGPHLTFTKLYH